MTDLKSITQPSSIFSFKY